MTCKDCIHYDICLFYLKGNENEKCVRFKNKANFVEIVKCKDCKHKVLTKGNRVMCSKNAQKMECVADWYGLTATDDNNFCSYGEKRERKNGSIL